jgi:hypothetical protein
MVGAFAFLESVYWNHSFTRRSVPLYAWMNPRPTEQILKFNSESADCGGSSHAGIAGSNSARGMDASFVRVVCCKYRPLQRADGLSKGLLLSV